MRLFIGRAPHHWIFEFSCFHQESRVCSSQPTLEELPRHSGVSHPLYGRTGSYRNRYTSAKGDPSRRENQPQQALDVKSTEYLTAQKSNEEQQGFRKCLKQTLYQIIDICRGRRMNDPTRRTDELAVLFPLEKSETLFDCPELSGYSRPRPLAELDGGDAYLVELPGQRLSSNGSQRSSTYDRVREPCRIPRKPVTSQVAHAGRVPNLPLRTDLSEIVRPSRSDQYLELSPVSPEDISHNDVDLEQRSGVHNKSAWSQFRQTSRMVSPINMSPKTPIPSSKSPTITSRAYVASMYQEIETFSSMPPPSTAIPTASSPSTAILTASSPSSNGAQSPFDIPYPHSPGCTCQSCRPFQQIHHPQVTLQYMVSLPGGNPGGLNTGSADASAIFGRPLDDEVTDASGFISTPAASMYQRNGHGINSEMLGYESPPGYTNVCREKQGGILQQAQLQDYIMPADMSHHAWNSDQNPSAPRAPRSPGRASAVVEGVGVRTGTRNPRRPTALVPPIVIHCLLCRQTFTGRWRKANRKRHERSQHNVDGVDPDLICRKCGKDYKRKDARKKHEWKKHGIGERPVKRRVYDYEDESFGPDYDRL